MTRWQSIDINHSMFGTVAGSIVLGHAVDSVVAGDHTAIDGAIWWSRIRRRD